MCMLLFFIFSTDAKWQFQDFVYLLAWSGGWFIERYKYNENGKPGNVTDSRRDKSYTFSVLPLSHSFTAESGFLAGWSEIMLILVSSGGKPCSSTQHNRLEDNTNVVRGRHRGLISTLRSLQLAMCDSTIPGLLRYVDFIACYNQMLNRSNLATQTVTRQTLHPFWLIAIAYN